MSELFKDEHVDNEVPQSSYESIQEDRRNLNASEKKDAFVFPEISEQEEARLNVAEQKIEKTCQSFAEALDSIHPWLTKELLDIYEKLEGIMWSNKENEEIKKDKENEKTILWWMAYKLLYEKHKDIFPEKLKDMLWEMLRDLSEYEEVKIKHKSLKEMLRSCASIASVQTAIDMAKFGGWRTFTPDNLGCHIPY